MEKFWETIYKEIKKCAGSGGMPQDSRDLIGVRVDKIEKAGVFEKEIFYIISGLSIEEHGIKYENTTCHTNITYGEAIRKGIGLFDELYENHKNKTSLNF